MEEIREENFKGSEIPKPIPAWKTWLESDDANRWIYGIFGALTIIIIFYWLQFSAKGVCCGDYDGYYHIRWSQLLWENFSQFKWLPEFKWLPLTSLNPNGYADHHFLFHLLQIPFLWFFEPVMAAKVAAVVFASTAVFLCYWLILRYRVDYPLLWLLALLTCANPFYYRMNMAKAPPLAIICMVIGIWLLFEKRYIWLLPLTFLFAWTYSLFPTLVIAAFIWSVIISWNEQRVEWKPFAYSLGGAILGLIINPYFPSNVWLFLEHLFTKLKVGDFQVAVGGEWYPYSSLELLTHLPIALLAVLLGYILYTLDDRKKLPEKSTFFLAFVTILLVSMFRSKRFAEYFPPFAVLFGAFSFQFFRESLRPKVLPLPEDFRRDIEPYLDKEVQTKDEQTWELVQNVAVGTVGVLLFLLMFYNFRGIEIEKLGLKQVGLAQELRDDAPPSKFKRGADWMLQNIPEGERIFNTGWDDFPKLFFLDQKHSYVAGLDPTYLFTKNPELSKLFDEITTGKTDDPAPIIRERFGARFIFSRDGNDDFYAKIMESGWAEKVYDDDECYILKIRDQKGEPPAESNVDENETVKDEDVEEVADNKANVSNEGEVIDNTEEKK